MTTDVALVPSFFAVTVTPGIAPPLVSTTTPVIDEVDPPWPNAGDANDSDRAATNAHFAIPLFMERVLHTKTNPLLSGCIRQTVGEQ
jgi:hypothetical protein